MGSGVIPKDTRSFFSDGIQKCLRCKKLFSSYTIRARNELPGSLLSSFRMSGNLCDLVGARDLSSPVKPMS